MAPPFKLHQSGKQFLNGINTFGCNSIILYNNDIWKFKYFGDSGTKNYNLMFYVKLNDDASESNESKWFTNDEIRASSRVELS
jgi:hypothetical protein